VAFNCITIPSMMSVWYRLSLYLIASQVALVNGCLPQAESMLKASISLFAEIINMSGA